MLQLTGAVNRIVAGSVEWAHRFSELRPNPYFREGLIYGDPAKITDPLDHLLVAYNAACAKVEELLPRVLLAYGESATRPWNEVIEWAITDGRLTTKQLRQALAVSESTISRWRSGEVAPHPLMRKAGAKKLEELAKAQSRHQ
jgi:hypothetical protein